MLSGMLLRHWIFRDYLLDILATYYSLESRKMNLIDLTKQFGTEQACVDFLQAMRWPEGVECLKCGGKKVSRFQTNERARTRVNPDTAETELKRIPQRFIYSCQDPKCGHKFSVTTGTVFHDTHLSLEKWFMASALMCNAKKGLSAKQMQRDLKTAYKTAWYLNHRIRKAMALLEAVDDQKLVGTVEADETFIGSKKYDKRRKRAKYDKEPVFGMVERGGRAKTFHIPEVNRFYVIDKIKDNIAITADHVYTDDSR